MFSPLGRATILRQVAAETAEVRLGGCRASGDYCGTCGTYDFPGVICLVVNFSRRLDAFCMFHVVFLK